MLKATFKLVCLAVVFGVCINTPVHAESLRDRIERQQRGPTTLNEVLEYEATALEARAELEACLQQSVLYRHAELLRRKDSTQFVVEIENRLHIGISGWRFDIASDWLDPKDRGFQNIEWPEKMHVRSSETRQLILQGKAIDFFTPERFFVEVTIRDVKQSNGEFVIQPLFDVLPLRVTSLQGYDRVRQLLCGVT